MSGKYGNHLESRCLLTKLWGNYWSSHFRDTLAKRGVASSCWNHGRSLLDMLGPVPRFRRPRAVHYCCRTSVYRLFITVRGSLPSSSYQNCPMMPCFDITAHAVHFLTEVVSVAPHSEQLYPQNVLFLLLTCPDNKK